MVQIDFFLEMPLKNVRPPTLNDPQWIGCIGQMSVTKFFVTWIKLLD